MAENSATVFDVARVAGVSVAAVRRFYRRSGLVLPRTRDKIAKAAAGLGFEPERDLDSLSGSPFKRIAVISPYVTAYSFVERIKGVGRTLPSDSHEMITYSVEDEAQLKRHLRLLSRPGKVDGVVLMALPLDGDSARQFKANKIPVVCIERENDGFPLISVDNVQGGRLAAEYLLQKGYRRPAFLGDTGIPLYAYSAADLRFQGFQDALGQAGVGLPEDRIAWHPQGIDTVPEALLKLLKSESPPDAVFCASDTEAVIVLRTCWELELRVPRDLAILGFDNIELTSFVGLSSVDQHLVRSGEDAAEMLMTMMNGTVRKMPKKQYELKIKERTTT